MQGKQAMVVLGLMAALGAAPALAHQGQVEHRKVVFKEYGEQLDFGRMGKSVEAGRTIEIEMNDTYRFAPARLTVRAGETVRLVFRNTGAQQHEWVLGTPQDIARHADLMRRFPNMEHDDPQYVHVPPGEQRELVWKFNRPGRFEFACLLPGHFEAGMNGFVEVR
jgi:uncharacterized cupredoxin-like copper-binding protein